ncbi:unnamed protein product [Allacma fusca]|uniref:Uncharacterized protein n=1 Tax=Allacma fusca TaxID=39272 RepID=A0A8J2NUU8_9HEXA|nr:unnamed protein product [Allacma fusca]
MIFIAYDPHEKGYEWEVYEREKLQRDHLGILPSREHPTHSGNTSFRCSLVKTKDAPSTLTLQTKNLVRYIFQLEK